ncbi:MAG: ligase-associated DNA damage response exonuclease [Bacteroidota bacterium]
MALLEFTNRGIYCAQGDFFIDPWKPVNKALITHGHADHSRWGHNQYLCVRASKPIIRHRLGPINIGTIEYGESTNINGVKVSFHPAGHIVGSSQIRVEYKGEVWVASGDYKLENDGLATAFEPVKCHTFITESTFGLPVYKWKPQEEIFSEINQWWQQNSQEGKVSLITSYALGKAQRVLQGLDESIGPIYTHGAVENVNEVMRNQGVKLKNTIRSTQSVKKTAYKGAMIIAPPSAVGSPWAKKFKPLVVAAASGWMTLRGARRRRGVDRGFVLSDHVDWDGLNQAIVATGAERVIVTHGYTDIFTKWLNEKGYQALAEKTEFEGELNEQNTSSEEGSKTEES